MSIGYINTGSVAAIDQDNKDVAKYITLNKFGRTPLPNRILSFLNNNDPFTVSDTQSLWVFVSVVYDNNKIAEIQKIKVFNKGKGTYGAGHLQFTLSDLKLISTESLTSGAIESNPLTQVITITQIGTLNVAQYISQANPSIEFQNVGVAPRLVKITEAGKEADYLFLAAGGVYGQGQLQTTASDFQILNENSSISDPTKEDKVSGVRAYGIDNYTAIVPELTELVFGYKILCQFENPNTGASTININELGVKEIRKEVDVALTENDLLGVHQLMYDGEHFQIIGYVKEYSPFTLNETQAIQEANNPSGSNRFATFEDLDARNTGSVPISGTTDPITGNIEIRSTNSNEKALILSKVGTVGITENPKFSFGRIVNGGINEPKLRILFIDDEAYTSEITCFEVEPSGTAASVRSVIGSHYEGFLEGEEKPLFRIASFLKDGNKSTRMEFGSGGNNETDIFLERWASWAFALVMGGSPKVIFYPDSILRQPGVVDAFQQTPINQVVATPNPDVKKLFYREGKGLVELGGDGIEKPLVNNNSYSTAETLTGGTWIDGKPIYRKVFTVADTSAGINNTHSLPIETLIYNDFKAKIETTFFNESLQPTNDLGYSGVSETHYYIENPRMWPLTNISLTIEYTKTTD